MLEKLKFLFANGAEVDLSPAHKEAIVLMQHTVCFGLLPLYPKRTIRCVPFICVLAKFPVQTLRAADMDNVMILDLSR